MRIAGMRPGGADGAAPLAGMSKGRRPFARLGLFARAIFRPAARPGIVIFALCFIATASVAGQGPRGITDDAGQSVTLPGPARRIVPLYSALAQILTELGAGERIVARTAADTVLPDELPVIGTHMRPNFELIVGLRPDLVVQLEGREEAGLAAQRLRELGIPVARFRISSFAELFSCIERLGVLAGKEEAAAALLAGFRADLALLEEQKAMFARLGPPPTVFFEVRYPNLLGAGGGNMLTDIARRAGAVNCLEQYPDRLVRLSEERLIAFNPDMYIVLEGPMNKNPLPVSARPHFRGLDAVQGGCLFTAREEIYSRPGAGSIRAARELAFLVHIWLL
ncbi:helical backbone metal receptor, partial [Desulfovibrio sp. OttesenSCG-928-A18]|nr:helical backbone metal receptor [Desulfovibrio sp. OttesenSCG-928-A18]